MTLEDHVRTRLAPGLYPFQSHWMDIAGKSVHYLDEGSGEPLVLLHGNPTWSFFYRRVISALSPRYRLVAPDHVGCGLSSRPSDAEFAYTLESHVRNLESVLDRLGLTSGVTLVMHDWGGMIGMACACRRPGRIARLVVLNTAAFLLPPGRRLPLRLRFVKGVPVLSTLLVRGLNGFAWPATRMAVKRPMPVPVRRAYTAPYDNWRDRIATLRFVQDIPLSPRDRSYRLAAWVDGHIQAFRDTPMLICWGEDDFVFDAAILAEWRRRFPHAEVHTFPDAGHYVLEDAAGPFVERLSAFLERHPVSEAPDA
jgi:cis-3-alkyl-4-acyloxetan-2-one decarboxylase